MQQHKDNNDDDDRQQWKRIVYHTSTFHDDRNRADINNANNAFSILNYTDFHEAFMLPNLLFLRKSAFCTFETCLVQTY